MRRRAKLKTIKNHAKSRAWSRFGLRSRDIEAIGAMIRAGNSRLVEKQSNRVSVHAVNYAEQDINVVYDCLRGTVITFLYPEGSELYPENVAA